MTYLKRLVLYIALIAVFPLLSMCAGTQQSCESRDPEHEPGIGPGGGLDLRCRLLHGPVGVVHVVSHHRGDLSDRLAHLPLQPGDMLVASTLPGYAMRASGNPPQGTVLGKALSGLDEETGVIKMLVMLQ